MGNQAGQRRPDNKAGAAVAQGEPMEKEAVGLRRKLNAGRASEDDRRRLIQVFEELERLLLADDKRRQRETLLTEMTKSQLGFLKELERMTREVGE